MKLNWRKPLSLLLALCLTVGLCPSLIAPALAADADFVMSGSTLTAYNGPGGDVVIPESVTAISAGVFSGNTTLTSVTIPGSLTTIPQNCFQGCTGLREVVLSTGVSRLGYACFSGCTSLRSISLPGSLTQFDGDCFNGCTNLTSITLPDSLRYIYAACFANCSSLAHIDLPKNLGSLGDSCFARCTSLTEITLPESLTSLGSWCFQSCTSLTEIRLPEGVTSIGPGCFAECTSLTSVNWPKGVTTIPSQCFQQCSSLRSFDIPNTVKSLGKYAFLSSGLTSVDLPDGLESIGERCFDGTSITELTIPASVTELERLCMGGYGSISKLKTLTFEGDPNNIEMDGRLIPDDVAINLQPGTTPPDWLVTRQQEEEARKMSLTLSRYVRTVTTGIFATGGGSDEFKRRESELTATNTGSVPLTLETPTSKYCEVIMPSRTTLAPGETATIKLLAKETVEPGKYSEPLTIRTREGASADLDIDVSVMGVADLSIDQEALDFGSAGRGYTQPDAKTVTVKNTGTLTLTLEGPVNPDFELGKLSKTTLSPGETVTFTVRPKAGLALGSYTGTLLVSGRSDGSWTRNNARVTASAKFEVTNQKPSLSASPASLEFGTEKTGYTQVEAKTVTVTNSGSAAVTLNTPALSGAGFELAGSLSASTLAAGDKATLSVRPKSGLSKGTYTATLKLTGSDGASAAVDLKFAVNDGDPVLSVSPASLNFGSLEETYTQPAAKTVTVTNNSKDSVTLQAPASTSYVLGPLSRTTLAAGEKATFTVQPKAGLKAGGYSEQITVKTAQDDSASVSVDFTVGKKGPTFVDVKESDWFFDDVEYVYEKGLMNGVGSRRFDPDGTTTRGQIVTILYRLEGEPFVSGRSSFADVAGGQYYANAVKWAADHQIVNGYSSVSFGPDDPITREQMAAILYRYAGYKHYNVSTRADLSKFRDAGSVSSYALDAISWANSQGLINGVTGTTIEPQGSAVRAQAAAILHRFCENIAR